MNFEAFLPDEIKDALNRELEILKETAIKGSMDTLKETNEDEEWEKAAIANSSDDSGHSTPTKSSSWNESVDKTGDLPLSTTTSSLSTLSKPINVSTPPSRKLPPFMATKPIIKDDVSSTIQNEQGGFNMNNNPSSSSTSTSSKPISAASAALLAVEQQSGVWSNKQSIEKNTSSFNDPNSSTEEDASFSFSEARNQVLNRMTQDDLVFTPTPTPSQQQQQQQQQLISPIPSSVSSFPSSYLDHDSSCDSIDRALFSPQQNNNNNNRNQHNSSINPSLSPLTPSMNTPDQPSSQPSPPPPTQQQQQQQHTRGGHVPNYEMHSQVEALISGRVDENLPPRTSLVEQAASKRVNQNASLFHSFSNDQQPSSSSLSSQSPGYDHGISSSSAADRASNPFLRGIDPLHPKNLSSTLSSTHHPSSSLLPPMNHHLRGGGDKNDLLHYGNQQGGGGGGSMYNDDNDPILASIHNQNYLSDQVKKHHLGQSSYLINEFEGGHGSSGGEFERYNRHVGSLGDRNHSLYTPEEEAHQRLLNGMNGGEDVSWLSEQSYMKSVNASQYDPFKQLMLSSNGLGSDSGTSMMDSIKFCLANQSLSTWLALWEEWKYTFYVIAPGIALMALYFKFSYAEEIN